MLAQAFVLPGFFRHKLAKAKDDSQEVVKLVGDASLQLAYSLDLLCLSQLCFQGSPLSNILSNEFKSLDDALLIGQRSTAQANSNDFAVSSVPLHFVFYSFSLYPLL